MIEIAVAISVLVLTIAVIALVLGLFYFVFREYGSVHERLNGIEKRLTKIETSIEPFAPMARKPPGPFLDALLKFPTGHGAFLKTTRGSKQHNPGPANYPRKEFLIDKWRRGELNYNEALELRGILEQEAKLVRPEDVIKILIGLFLLGLLIAALTKK